MESRDVITWRCEGCKQSFTYEHTWKIHKCNCKRFVFTAVVERAKQPLWNIIEGEDSPIYVSTRENPSLVSHVIDAQLMETLKRHKGWAKRTAYGQTLGTNSGHLFKEDIMSFVERGVTDWSKKTSAFAMKEELRRRYPTRYDLSNEQFITRLVFSQLQKLLKTTNIETCDASTSRKCIQTVYADALRHFILQDVTGSLNPRHAMQAVIERLHMENACLAVNFPSDLQFKSLCSRYHRMS